MNENKKKIIIIGAGIAGMSAGIYALDNGYDVTIYEKHSIPGGQCTGWTRDGVYIDGCAHWIVGTNKNSDLYPLWRHVGAIKENTVIHDTEYFCKYDIGGEIVTFYSDLDKLEKELNRVSPIDKRAIHRFILDVKAYQNVRIPTAKPLNKMNPLEYTLFGMKLLPMATRFVPLQAKSCLDYSKRFKSKILQEVFADLLGKEYNAHSFIYVMQALSKHDAGMIEGGSRKIAMDMLKNYVSKGGKIKLNQEVSKIIVEDNVAKGIIANNEEIRADFVVSTTDAHHTLYNLLENKYYDKFYMSKFNDRENYPLQAGFVVAYKISRNITTYPKMNSFAISPIKIGDMVIDKISLRNHAFDKTINKYETTATVLINTIDSVYDYLKAMSKEEYLKEKERIGNHLLKEIKRYFNFTDDEIKLIDVATPLTHERYCNAYRGSYMSFLTTKKARGIMGKNYIKGLKNFYMAGQWVMPPGGLPVALFTGKHAIYSICCDCNYKFIDLDERFKETAYEMVVRIAKRIFARKNTI